MRRRENYINYTCKGWTVSTGGHNSVHLNDNGMPASCFSQHTLTPAIITSERASSLLWETYNTPKALFTAEPRAGVFFFRIKMREVFICKNPPQLSISREDCIRFYCELKSLPISASKLSLFNSIAGIRPRAVKRVAAFLWFRGSPLVFCDTIQLQCWSMRALWLSSLFPGRLSKQYSTATSHSRSIYAGPRKINCLAIFSTISWICYRHQPKIQRPQY